jgi:hypothetical protein
MSVKRWQYAVCWMWTAWCLDLWHWNGCGWILAIGPMRLSRHPAEESR